MFNFLGSLRRHSVATVQHLHHPSLILLLSLRFRVRCIASNLNSSNDPSFTFTVSYLIETCGLSKVSALTASRRLRLETPENPNAVLALFKNHGFSKTQIARAIKNYPRVLVTDVEKTLLPKFEFLRSRGVSSSHLATILTANCSVLGCSLERHIIPAFNFISNLLQSDDKAVLAIRRLPRLLSYDVQSYVLPNFNTLRNSGVPQSYILRMFVGQPQVLLMSPDKLKDNIKRVKKMGFDPTRMVYLRALFILNSMTRSTWENKIDTCKKWGWSEEEILRAFRGQPYFVIASQDEITAKLHFLMDKMGFQSSVIAAYPVVLMMSLKKRLLPRGLFVQDLLSSKGVVKGFSLRSLFMTSEKVFIQKFVNCYEAEAAILLKLYQEKLDLSSNWKVGMEASAHVES